MYIIIALESKHVDFNSPSAFTYILLEQQE